MKLVIFGLTISSSWGNGHATLWRGLCRTLIARGVRVVFFERDVPYYSEHRDLHELPGGRLVLYSEWEDVESTARAELADADVALTTSYCPDALAATALMREFEALQVFYDLDTPVTFSRLDAGESVDYLPEGGLGDFDLVLSYTGGAALDQLRQRLGARFVAPLYGSVDPAEHHPVAPRAELRSDLSYLGTYAADRQQALEELFIEPARHRSDLRFLIAGAMYPQDFPWTENIFFARHLPPGEHPAFYCSSRLTLNITRGSMASMGYCPSGRLFEAAACGAPILSDSWTGLNEFFTPGEEILLAESTADALRALTLSDAELQSIGRAARERALAEHTAGHRAIELEALFNEARCAPVHA
ncbi:MAG: CgeB family protein [Chthoniobacteraceae bacterium]